MVSRAFFLAHPALQASAPFFSTQTCACPSVRCCATTFSSTIPSSPTTPRRRDASLNPTRREVSNFASVNDVSALSLPCPSLRSHAGFIPSAEVSTPPALSSSRQTQKPSAHACAAPFCTLVGAPSSPRPDQPTQRDASPTHRREGSHALQRAPTACPTLAGTGHSAARCQNSQAPPVMPPFAQEPAILAPVQLAPYAPAGPTQAPADFYDVAGLTESTAHFLAPPVQHDTLCLLDSMPPHTICLALMLAYFLQTCGDPVGPFSPLLMHPSAQQRALLQLILIQLLAETTTALSLAPVGGRQESADMRANRHRGSMQSSRARALPLAYHPFPTWASLAPFSCIAGQLWCDGLLADWLKGYRASMSHSLPWPLAHLTPTSQPDRSTHSIAWHPSISKLPDFCGSGNFPLANLVGSILASIVAALLTARDSPSLSSVLSTGHHQQPSWQQPSGQRPAFPPVALATMISSSSNGTQASSCTHIGFDLSTNLPLLMALLPHTHGGSTTTAYSSHAIPPVHLTSMTSLGPVLSPIPMQIQNSGFHQPAKNIHPPWFSPFALLWHGHLLDIPSIFQLPMVHNFPVHLLQHTSMCTLPFDPGISSCCFSCLAGGNIATVFKPVQSSYQANLKASPINNNPSTTNDVSLKSNHNGAKQGSNTIKDDF